MDATGVQDLFFEAHDDEGDVGRRSREGEKTPENWMDDPGFALTQANWDEREMDMWGCKLFHDTGESLTARG